ncbi:Rha family transcriptional regulator [Shigella flexneri]|uniref:Rha family phage regulatory protein n=3 Tax=Shigella flexneri TaxID=623 RepID=UPI00021265A1|nr:peptidase [Shigella flexneri]EGM58834.1 phage regulatory, Rha family protein [Shigella flexneri SFJ17B]EIQ03030.1 phage regulatory, Rha family protein [Shigella flexneri 2850-71]EIQ7486124.1 Rha family transcriptional regulator [Escherichia coli]EAB9320339.1 peptidase [Shigella flexneri]
MNSLTANNRLSQQLVVSVAEHLLLRHECRLPDHLAVSNHRELYLTVGGELCRNLTAGFVTEEGFMSMLFVGSQKHSALSIFAKTTSMSALVLCGNSGVILLSVKDHQHIDSAIPGRYTVQAPYKAGAGIGVLKLITEHNRAHAVFSCHEHCYAQIMVGRTGPTSVGPGSVVSGNANPVRLTTSVIGVPCGEFSKKLTTGAVTMTTLPTLTQPEIAIVDGQAVTSSLAVANFFSKRHDDVLKKIRTLECSASFTARNFSVSDYTDCTGRKLPCYQITRDGFAFLAMGFTGKRAARFKEAYINAFNQMEKLLSKPSTLSDAADNASVLYSHLSVIHKVWLQQLYPMLAKAESPLAVSLYDYINDASALACLINLSLNPSEVRGRK